MKNYKKRSKQSATHFSDVLQGIQNGLQRSNIYIQVIYSSLHFFLLHNNFLTRRVISHLRKQFFKYQGMLLIKQIESNLPEPLPTTRIKVYYEKELLDYLLELNEEKLVEHISSIRLAKTIDAVFDIGMSADSMVTYIDNYKYRKV